MPKLPDKQYTAAEALDMTLGDMRSRVQALLEEGGEEGYLVPPLRTRAPTRRIIDFEDFRSSGASSASAPTRSSTGSTA